MLHALSPVASSPSDGMPLRVEKILLTPILACGTIVTLLVLIT